MISYDRANELLGIYAARNTKFRVPFFCGFWLTSEPMSVWCQLSATPMVRQYAEVPDSDDETCILDAMIRARNIGIERVVSSWYKPHVPKPSPECPCGIARVMCDYHRK
jgi:hypothetical protein